MYAGLGVWLAVVAVSSLIKFAIGDRHAWWRLILIVLALGVIGIAALWVYGGGQFYHHVGVGGGASYGVLRLPGARSAAARQHGQGPGVGERRPRLPRQTWLAKTPKASSICRVRVIFVGEQDRLAGRAGRAAGIWLCGGCQMRSSGWLARRQRGR